MNTTTTKALADRLRRCGERADNDDGDLMIDAADALEDAIEAISSSQAKCVIGEYCSRHRFIHGAEAEELRKRIEELITGGDDIYDDRLRDLLDEVDARDSLAFVEAAASPTQDPITSAEGARDDA